MDPLGPQVMDPQHLISVLSKVCRDLNKEKRKLTAQTSLPLPHPGLATEFQNEDRGVGGMCCPTQESVSFRVLTYETFSFLPQSLSTYHGI